MFARLEDDEGVQHVSVLEVLPEAIDATWSDVEAMDDETLLTFDTAEGPLRFVVRAALELPDQVVGQGVRLEASGTGLAVTREEDGGLLLALHRWSGEEEVEGEWVWNVPRTLDIGPVALETHPSCYVEDPCPRFYIFYDIIVVLQGAVAAEISPFEEADVVVDQAPYRVDVHGVHDRSGRGSIEGQTVECADLTPPAFDVDVIWLGET